MRWGIIRKTSCLLKIIACRLVINLIGKRLLVDHHSRGQKDIAILCLKVDSNSEFEAINCGVKKGLFRSVINRFMHLDWIERCSNFDFAERQSMSDRRSLSFHIDIDHPSLQSSIIQHFCQLMTEHHVAILFFGINFHWETSNTIQSIKAPISILGLMGRADFGCSQFVSYIYKMRKNSQSSALLVRWFVPYNNLAQKMDTENQFRT